MNRKINKRRKAQIESTVFRVMEDLEDLRHTLNADPELIATQLEKQRKSLLDCIRLTRR